MKEYICAELRKLGASHCPQKSVSIQGQCLSWRGALFSSEDQTKGWRGRAHARSQVYSDVHTHVHIYNTRVYTRVHVHDTQSRRGFWQSALSAAVLPSLLA